jgi:hypothetical protein
MVIQRKTEAGFGLCQKSEELIGGKGDIPVPAGSSTLCSCSKMKTARLIFIYADKLKRKPPEITGFFNRIKVPLYG